MPKFGNSDEQLVKNERLTVFAPVLMKNLGKINHSRPMTDLTRFEKLIFESFNHSLSCFGLFGRPFLSY
jgi:hypothetical protein